MKITLSSLDITVSCLLVAYVLFVSSNHELQHALWWFADECEVAGMGMDLFKSEIMVLDQKKSCCLFSVDGLYLKQTCSNNLVSCKMVGWSEGWMGPHLH